MFDVNSAQSLDLYLPDLTLRAVSTRLTDCIITRMSKGVPFKVVYTAHTHIYMYAQVVSLLVPLLCIPNKKNKTTAQCIHIYL